MQSVRHMFVILLVILTLSPSQSLAVVKNKKKVKKVQKVQKVQTTQPAPETFTETIERKMLQTGDSISATIDKTAEAIDLGLAGRKYTRKPNTSSANISYLTTWTEGGEVKSSTDFGLNLRLPNVERRWQLRFSSYDEEKESRDLRRQRVRTTARERDYGAGLVFFEKLGNVKTSFLPRLRLKDPLEMNYILRFESDSKYKNMYFIPRLDLFADATKGTGEFTSFEFQFELTPKLDFILHNTQEYQEDGNFFSTQHGFSFDYSLSENRGTGFSTIFESINRPSFHLNSITVSTVYVQQIYPKRLNYSLTPFLQFAKLESFKGKAGISFNLDLLF